MTEDQMRKIIARMREEANTYAKSILADKPIAGSYVRSLAVVAAMNAFADIVDDILNEGNAE